MITKNENMHKAGKKKMPAMPPKPQIQQVFSHKVNKLVSQLFDLSLPMAIKNLFKVLALKFSQMCLQSFPCLIHTSFSNGWLIMCCF